MTTTSIKKKVDSYLPLLTSKQQNLVLEMIKTFLNVESETERISNKQYNKELEEAITRIENSNSVSNSDAKVELSK